MTTIDERAQRARRAVDDTVATLEPDAIDASRAGRGSHTAAALAFIAIVAVGGWYATRLGANEVTVDTDATADQIAADGGEAGSNPAEEALPPTGEQQPTYLVFDPAPDGYSPMIIPDVPFDEEIDIRWTIYGRDGSGDPFADGDLGIGRIRANGAEVPVEDILSGTQIDIAGTTVWYDNDDALAWLQDDGSITGVLSTSFDEDALLDVARSIIVDGAVDPRGLDLLVADGSTPFVNVLGGSGDVLYTDDQVGFGETGAVTISVGEPPTENDLVIMLWLSLLDGTQDLRPVQLSESTIHDGQETTITRVEGQFGRLVVGTGSEAVTITPLGSFLSLPDEELLALFDTLRPATATEVETMIKAGQTAFENEGAFVEERPGHVTEEALNDRTEPFVSVSLDDGAIWSMASDELGRPCVLLEKQHEFSEYCVSLADELVTGDGSPWFISDDPPHAIALLGTGSADGITNVEVALENGRVEPGSVVNTETGTFWFVHLVDTARPVSLHLTDVAGGTQDHLLPLDAFGDSYGRFTIAPFEK